MARPEYPLSAVVGAGRLRVALSLLVIDPLLKGLAVAGRRGTGKTTACRGIRRLLPEGAPFVEAPPSVALDRLTGGVDSPAVFGRRRMPGLLEEANRGVLFTDHINLFSLPIISRIASASNAADPATRFVWLAAFDPEDGELPRLAVDAFGLHIEMDAAESVADRQLVACRAIDCQDAPAEFATRFGIEDARNADRVRAARDRLRDVIVDCEARRRLCDRASAAGLDGQCGEIFALRAARAHAALCGRTQVSDADVRLADEFVIAPRARLQQRSSNRPGPRPLDHPDRPSGGMPKPAAAPKSDKAVEHDVRPIDNAAPDLPRPALGGGSSANRRGRAERDSDRGRYAGWQDRDPGHGAIALDATLRAAAPFQRVRRRSGEGVRIVASDLRFKRFRRKSGVAVVIALDASGSMANNRIQQAKGAVTRLLRDAYVHRDSVALIAFRGDRAETLMKLSRSVELARRALDHLPAGGGTPMAAGIVSALREAALADSRALVVLLTDGRPNVSSTGEPVWQELERVADSARTSKSVIVLIDTNREQRRNPAAERLAGLLGAQILPLPRFDARSLHGRLVEVLSGMR